MTLRLLVVLALLLLPASAAVAASPGDRDPDFNGGAWLTVNPSPPPSGNYTTNFTRVALDSTGRPSVGGTVFTTTGSRGLITRRNRDGSPDTGFGGDGLVDAQQYTGASNLVLIGLGVSAADRLTAGFNQGQTGGIAATYTSSGGLDSDWGDQNTPGVTPLDSGFTGVIEATLVAPDGSLYTVGHDYPLGDSQGVPIIAHRLDPDGKPDAAYGGNDFTVAFIPRSNGGQQREGLSAALDSQGRMVIATTAKVSGVESIFVMRLTTAGKLDPTFSGDGKASAPSPIAGKTPHANSVALGPDNAIAVASNTDVGGGYDMGATKFTSAGDLAWNTYVHVTDPVNGTIANSRAATAAAVQPDGKVLIAGGGNDQNEGGNIVLVRLSASGAPDGTFGGNGVVVDPSGHFDLPVVNALRLTADGKRLYAVGNAGLITRYLLTNPSLEPDNQKAPTVSGTPLPGQTLTCAPGTWKNAAANEITVTWDRAPRATKTDTDPAWFSVGGGRTYVVKDPADLGSRLRCHEKAITANGSGDAYSGSVRVDTGPPAQVRAPVTNGSPVIGQGKLACDVGEWTNGPDLRVRWLRDGAAIDGATDAQYTLTYDDRRHKVGCEVTAVNDIGSSAPAVANVLAIIAAAPTIQRAPVVTLGTTGQKATDQRLTCGDPGTWDEDYGSYEYRWLREGVEIAGATDRTYDATTDDLGRLLQCVVFSTNPAGRSKGAESNKVLVPLPVTGVPGKLYVSGGFNRLDPVNWLAVSKEYLDVIGQLAKEHRRAAVVAKTADCRAGADANAQPPEVSDYKTNTIIGGPKLCGILIQRPGAVFTTPTATYYGDYGQTCSIPDLIDNGLHRCPTLKIPIDRITYDALSKLSAGDQARVAQTRPLEVLWDFDNDGRTDATCDPDAPILRSIYNRGYYRPHAVIVNADSGATGIYSVTDGNWAFFPESSSQKGSVRGNQPFACKTSLEPPPEVSQPCINEVTVGRVHMTGNLCPISARRIPESELGGLPPEVQKTLTDQALNGPLRRRSAPAALGEGRLGGLPISPRSTAGETSTQVSALATLDAARESTIPAKWEAALKQQASFDLPKAQTALDQIYISRGTSFLNGVKMDPVGGAATILVPSDAGQAINGIKKMTISSTKVATSLGGLPIGDPGKLSQDVEDRARSEAQAVLKGANLDQLASDLRKKLDLGPFKLAGDAKVKLNPDGTATIEAYAELPQLLTKPGSKPIRVGVTVNATREGRLTLNGISMRAPAAYIGAVLISNLQLDYNAGGLAIQGKLLFPPVNQGIAINRFRLGSHGEFQELDVDYLAGAGQGINIGPGVFLTKIGGGLSLNPDEVRGRAGVSVGPSAGGGCPTAGIDAQFVVHFAPDPFFVDANGTVGLVCIPVGGAHFYADSTGLVSLNANVDLDIGVLYIKAGLNGKLSLPRWQVDLRGDGGIRHLLEATVKALIGNLGVAGCGRVEVFPETLISDSVTIAGGAGVRFSNGRPPLSYPELLGNIHVFDGCNLSSWSPFGRDLRAAGPDGMSFTIGRPAPAVVPLQLTGVGGPPRVTITAPDGKVIDASRLGEDFAQGTDVSGMTEPSSSRTILFVRGAPGTWRIAPVDGSPPIADLKRATVLPDAKASGSVGGAGAARRLRYRVPKVKGQVVTFVEQSARGQRVIKTVKTGGKGTQAFVTSEGGGSARTVVAQVAQDGLPRDNITVARFRAPSPRAAKARHLRIRRHGHRATVTWRRSFYTRAYLVSVQTGDGHRFVLRPKARRVTFGGLSKGEGATVSVTSIAASGRRGATVTASLRGARHFSGFHNKKRPKVKRHKKKRRG